MVRCACLCALAGINEAAGPLVKHTAYLATICNMFSSLATAVFPFRGNCSFSVIYRTLVQQQQQSIGLALSRFPIARAERICKPSRGLRRTSLQVSMQKRGAEWRGKFLRELACYERAENIEQNLWVCINRNVTKDLVASSYAISFAGNTSQFYNTLLQTVVQALLLSERYKTRIFYRDSIGYN